MASNLRWDLLPALLAHLPREEADSIGRLDPLDYRTHVDAYAAVRRLDARVDEHLLRDLVLGLLRHLEDDFIEPQAVADRIKQRRHSRGPGEHAGPV